MISTIIACVIANILSIVIVLALFLGFVFLLVPQIFASLETIINNLPETLNSFYHWAYRTSSSIPSLHNWIQGMRQSHGTRSH